MSWLLLGQFGQHDDVGAALGRLDRLPQARCFAQSEVEDKDGGVLQQAGSEAHLQRVAGNHLRQRDEQRIGLHVQGGRNDRFCAYHHRDALEVNGFGDGEAH